MYIDTIKLAGRIYNLDRKINYRFVPVFWLRCQFHKKYVVALQEFLSATELRRRIFQVNPQFFGQLTRNFFFRNSHIKQRYDAITETMTAMEGFFRTEALEKMYLDANNPLILLEIPYTYKEDGEEWTDKLEVGMLFRSGEVREGAMTLFIRQGQDMIYHVNFWLWQENNVPFMYIGCHQGSKRGLGINKQLTKAFFGYRPKNLIIFLTRILADTLGVKGLYAVSNYGFYAQNHLGRRNRKLLVSYDDFWQECGGALTRDKRFFQLPLEEPRKDMEEVPTRKRAVYRKRFAFLDKLAEDFRASLSAQAR